MTTHQPDDKNLRKDRQSVSETNTYETPTQQTDNGFLPATSRLKPHDVMRLQRTLGNKATQKLVIQRGVDDGYQLEVGSAAGLVEEKYVDGVDPATGVQFTAFTSCIGIIGLKNDKMVAAHLVMRGKNEKPVDPDSLRTVFSGATNITIFGHISAWSNVANGTPITAVRGALGAISHEYTWGDGSYKMIWSTDSNDWEADF